MAIYGGGGGGVRDVSAVNGISDGSGGNGCGGGAVMKMVIVVQLLVAVAW